MPLVRGTRASLLGGARSGPFSVLFTNSTNAIVSASTGAFTFLAAATVEAWVLPLDATWLRICDDGGVILSAASGLPTINVNGGGQVSSATPLAAGQWSHIAGVFTGTNNVLYVNGVQVATVANSGTTGSGAFYTVGNRSGNDRPFVGSMQEFRLSNNARYTSGFTPQKSKFSSDGNTVFLWHMNEGSGIVCKDSGPNNIPGTFGGTVLPTWGPGLF